MSKLRIYGDWAGNPKGRPEDITKCVETVWPQSGWVCSQCSRSRGHGKDKLYCKQHAKRYPALDQES